MTRENSSSLAAYTLSSPRRAAASATRGPVIRGGSRWNPDAPYLSDSSHDSDSGDEEGSVEGIDWEWMDLPFGFERVKFVFNRAEARHRRRAARRQAEADARVEDAWAERVYGPGASDSDDMVSV